MSILDDIKAYTISRIEKEKAQTPLSILVEKCGGLPKKEHKFRSALCALELSIIAEIKKASPSKGVIDPVFDYLSIAKEYEKAGVSAISCLTEPKWFLGSDFVFEGVRKCVSTPLLRKEFIVDEYQLYQSFLLGADSVLLIASICTDNNLSKYKKILDGFGIDVLFEAHDESEVRRGLDLGFEIIGVNNRNLSNFSVDFKNSARLASLIKGKALFVAESGVKSASDIKQIKALNADAVLVGEVLMRSCDKHKTILEFKNA